jgi:hypothetical protein
VIHLGPIFRPDYNSLTQLSQEKGFEIVVCHPFFSLNDDFCAQSLADYNNYMTSAPPEKRLIPPKLSNPHFLIMFNRLVNALMFGASYMVLKRKEA